MHHTSRLSYADNASDLLAQRVSLSTPNLITTLWADDHPTRHGVLWVVEEKNQITGRLESLSQFETLAEAQHFAKGLLTGHVA